MDISPVSVSGQLYRELPVPEERDPEMEEEVWKEILKYPFDGWHPSSLEETRILNPSRVLGRMLCVKIDKIMRVRMQTWSNSKEHEPPSFSWILRYTNRPWKPGDVLQLVYEIAKQTGQDFNKEYEEVKKYFPMILDDSNPKNAEDLFQKESNNFSNLSLMHISAPKFHHGWEDLIHGNALDDKPMAKQVFQNGKEKVVVSALPHGERPIDIHFNEWKSENSEDTSILMPIDLAGGSDQVKQAKQHWSMIINTELEEFCDGLDNCDIIQAGGGHVLLVVGENVSDKEMNERADEYLKKISNDWQDKRHWSPLLWASWDGSATYHRRFPEKWDIDEVKSFVEELDSDFLETRRKLEDMKRFWVPFERTFELDRGSRYKPESNKHCTIYLDVINLGERCWTKGGEVQRLENPDDRLQVPFRSREATIEGFILSRKMTAMIESTFGMFIQRYLPSRIDSMGGDEIVAEVDRADFLRIVQDIEDHCWSIHSNILDDKPQLTWWVLCSESPDVPDTDGIKMMKDVLRNQMQKGIQRFVNPMWSKIAEDTEPEDEEWTTKRLKANQKENLMKQVWRDISMRRVLYRRALNIMGTKVYEENESQDFESFMGEHNSTMKNVLVRLGSVLHDAVLDRIDLGIYDKNLLNSINKDDCHGFVLNTYRNSYDSLRYKGNRKNGQKRKLEPYWTSWNIEGEDREYSERYDAQKAWCSAKYGKNWWSEDKVERLMESMQYISGKTDVKSIPGLARHLSHIFSEKELSAMNF